MKLKRGIIFTEEPMKVQLQPRGLQPWKCCLIITRVSGHSIRINKLLKGPWIVHVNPQIQDANLCFVRGLPKSWPSLVLVVPKDRSRQMAALGPLQRSLWSSTPKEKTRMHLRTDPSWKEKQNCGSIMYFPKTLIKKSKINTRWLRTHNSFEKA